MKSLCEVARDYMLENNIQNLVLTNSNTHLNEIYNRWLKAGGWPEDTSRGMIYPTYKAETVRRSITSTKAGKQQFDVVCMKMNSTTAKVASLKAAEF